MATPTMRPSVSPEGDGWLTQHPAVAIALALAVMTVPAMLILRQSWARWRSTGPKSRRLEGLRDVVFAGYWICVTAVAILLPNHYLTVPVLWNATVILVVWCGSLQALVTFKHRQERHEADEELRRQGLPARIRVMSWKRAALLCCAIFPFILMALVFVAAVALAVIFPKADYDAESMTVVVTAVLILSVLVWGPPAGYLTLRQYKRQRVAEREFWSHFRAHQRAHRDDSEAAHDTSTE
jgi:cytochrome bd-type quinol oxidase subunit 2